MLSTPTVGNCLVCGALDRFHMSENAASGVYEANLRIVYTSRSINKRVAAGSVLCVVLKQPMKFSK